MNITSLILRRRYPVPVTLEKKLEVALRNCLAMAVRMQRRVVPRHHEQVSIPGDPWTDIVRFCAEAGVVPNILREADDAG